MKHVRDTSIACYHDDVKPSLGRREQIVLDALCAWERNAPTAYELLKTLQARGLAFDLNAVRPRITSLLAKGLVVAGDKRICAVTGKKVYTWIVATPRPPASNLLELMEAP